MTGCCDEWGPCRVRVGGRVVVGICCANRREGTPEVVVVIRVPRRDERVGDGDEHLREEACGVRNGQLIRSSDPADVAWELRAGILRVELACSGFLGRPSSASLISSEHLLSRSPWADATGRARYRPRHPYWSADDRRCSGTGSGRDRDFSRESRICGGLKNRRLREGKSSITQVPISRTLSVCGEVAERLKAAVC